MNGQQNIKKKICTESILHQRAPVWRQHYI